MTDRRGWGRWVGRGVRLGVVGIVVGAAIVAWRAGWLDYERAGVLARRVRGLHEPVVAAVGLVVAWGVAGTLGFPALPLMIAGGVLFGTWIGTALNLAGTVVAAVGGYWVARAVARGAVQRWLAAHVPVGEMSRRRGMIAVARFRLLPVIPLAVGNFAAGLARMELGPYVAGTVIGQLPSTIIYTYFADALVRAAASGARGAAVRDAALASGALLLISAVPRGIGWWRGRARG